MTVQRRVIEIPSLTMPAGPVIEVVAATVAQLLHPHAEVVLHDLATGKIAQIWNPFSGRKPGEPSDLDDIDPELVEEDVVGPYEKASPKGARLKSITAILRDRAKIARFLLCINLDVSQFDAAAKLLQSLGATSESRPDWMFRRDIREQINLQIADHLKRHNLSIQSLDAAERVALIAHLDHSGAFQTRRAVDHIAAALGLSRTTVYLLLRQARDSAPRTPKPEPKTQGKTGKRK
jgi:predicted transcriptional regulator YheO